MKKSGYTFAEIQRATDFPLSFVHRWYQREDTLKKPRPSVTKVTAALKQRIQRIMKVSDIF